MSERRLGQMLDTAAAKVTVSPVAAGHTLAVCSATLAFASQSGMSCKSSKTHNIYTTCLHGCKMNMKNHATVRVQANGCETEPKKCIQDLHLSVQRLPLGHDGRHARQVAVPHSLTPLPLCCCHLQRCLCAEQQTMGKYSQHSSVKCCLKWRVGKHEWQRTAGCRSHRDLSPEGLVGARRLRLVLVQDGRRVHSGADGLISVPLDALLHLSLMGH